MLLVVAWVGWVFCYIIYIIYFLFIFWEGGEGGKGDAPHERVDRFKPKSNPRGLNSKLHPSTRCLTCTDARSPPHTRTCTRARTTRPCRGTLPYMAPEMIADPQHVTEKADVWSIGVVLWELLTLAVPFAEWNPNQLLQGGWRV